MWEPIANAIHGAGLVGIRDAQNGRAMARNFHIARQTGSEFGDAAGIDRFCCQGPVWKRMREQSRSQCTTESVLTDQNDLPHAKSPN